MVLLHVVLDPFSVVAASRLNFTIRILVLTKLWQTFATRALRGVEIACVWLMLCDLLVGDSPLLLLPPTGGSLLKVASLGVPPESQVIGGGLPDV